MKHLFLILSVCLAVRCGQAQTSSDLEDLLNRKYQQKLISRGDNFPDFNVRKDKMNLLLVALHKDIPVEDFQSEMGYSDSKMDSIFTLLTSRGWLHEIHGEYKPTVFVATSEDGRMLFELSKPLAEKIAKRIQENLPGIRKVFSETDISKSASFDEWSFLILSNVLLDNWQISDVEQEFLGQSARPTRHGKQYYSAILENESTRESFGIYGNQFGEISVYGNNREHADKSGTTRYISAKDNEIFTEMARDFLPDLISLLIENRPYIEDTFRNSVYSSEISFEEFFIWWYHFIYTQATDEMADMDMLTIPEDGNFVYGFQQN